MFMKRKLDNFNLKYHGVGRPLLTLPGGILHCNTFCCFESWQSSAMLKLFEPKECDVDLALRLDVLAVCAVFAFVGAILLGAF
jgi:hypothetical protein